MAMIFSAESNKLSPNDMKLLYRNNLILCSDSQLHVAQIPSWAVKEAERRIGKKITGTESSDQLLPMNKIDMSLKNKFNYPKLYFDIITEGYLLRDICLLLKNCADCSYSSLPCDPIRELDLQFDSASSFCMDAYDDQINHHLFEIAKKHGYDSKLLEKGDEQWIKFWK